MFANMEILTKEITPESHSRTVHVPVFVEETVCNNDSLYIYYEFRNNRNHPPNKVTVLLKN